MAKANLDKFYTKNEIVDLCLSSVDFNGYGCIHSKHRKKRAELTFKPPNPAYGGAKKKLSLEPPI